MPKKLSPVYVFIQTEKRVGFQRLLHVRERRDASHELSRRLRVAGREVLRRQVGGDDDGGCRQWSRSSFDVAANRVSVKNSQECGEANMLRSQIVQKEHGLVRKAVEEWRVSVSGKGDGIDLVGGIGVIDPSGLSGSRRPVSPHHCRSVTLSGLLLASEVG